MAVPPSRFKIGLFVVIALAAAAVVVIGIGAASVSKDTVRFHTYFDESVHGLDVGAPVKFRGVAIGSVSAIEIAPDQRSVDVVEQIRTEDVRRMGLLEPKTRRLHVPPDMRAQLGSQGITGVKFVSIDIFNPQTNPPPALSFPVPEAYIPAATSVLKTLEETLTTAMEKLPDLIDAVVVITGRVDKVVSQLEKDDLTGKAADALDRADRVLTTLQATLGSVDRAHLGEKASGALEGVTAAVAKLSGVLDRIDGDEGLVASLHRAADAIGGFGSGANAATRELDETLRGVREAAESIRVLADALERDPDMLLKGRAKAKTKANGGAR
jgi:paraquat-inducible protein B